jgi:hypothetical protein
MPSSAALKMATTSPASGGGGRVGVKSGNGGVGQQCASGNG